MLNQEKERKNLRRLEKQKEHLEGEFSSICQSHIVDIIMFKHNKQKKLNLQTQIEKISRKLTPDVIA